MGRPTKNVNHPLARLRDLLSEGTNHQVTRKDLAKRTGIPVASLKDIETGRYKMTPDVAIKIGFATGADPKSLLSGDSPPLDFRGKPFSKETEGLREPYPWSRELRETMKQLFLSAFDIANEKKSTLLFAFSFERWLLTTLQTFGMVELFAEKLTERLPLLEPALIIPEFRPRKGPSVTAWECFESEIQEEWNTLYTKTREANPASWDRFAMRDFLPHPTEDDKTAFQDCQKKLEGFRTQARSTVARRWLEAAAKAPPPKPASGKRPRSPGCPEA